MNLILYPFAFILLLAAPALAAITNIGNLGTAGTGISGTTLVITTGLTFEQHNIAIVRIASDNFSAADGDNSEVKSVADSAANTYSKICEHTYAEAGTGNGATISLWIGRAATQLSAGGTITITFANAISAKVAQAQEINVDDGNTLQIAGPCKTENINSADAGSLTTDVLPSKEYLFYRAIALESRSDTITTLTTNYTVVTAISADSGVVATSMVALAERRILTGTQDSSDPLLSNSTRDGASIYFALEECTPGVNCTGDVAVTFRRPPIIVQ